MSYVIAYVEGSVIVAEASPSILGPVSRVIADIVSTGTIAANTANDVKSLGESIQNSLSSNPTGAANVLASTMVGGQVTALILGSGLSSAAVEAAALAAGIVLSPEIIAVAVVVGAVGIGYGAGEYSLQLFRELQMKGEIVSTNGNPNMPTQPSPGDANGNGLPDILESIKQKYTDSKAITSPIILDLDGDGIETTAVGSGTWFDHDANGFAESTGWAGKDDGILVRDLDGNGTIDSGRELFGSETLLANGAKAANGFAALAELDSNQDGKIDANDAAYTTLKIWKDVNGDGTTDAGELLTLAEVGVQSLNVGYTASTAIDANGNQHQQIGSYTTTTGTTRAAEDVWFKVDKTNTIAEDWVAVSADIAALPDVTGYGNVYDLHQAMARSRKNDDEWRVAA